MELTDGISSQYSFADKRLNRQNEKEFVIESEYLTEKLPLNHQNDHRTIFSLYIDYETILNRSNKHSYYLEMMTKAFLVFHQELFSGAQTMLDSKIWYDSQKLNRCFPLLKQLQMLKLSAGKAKTIAEKSACNRQIKVLLKELEELL